MKLYVFPVAPNPTRVRLYLAEKRAGGARIDLEEVGVDLREGQQRTPEHLARNPFGKLPVLDERLSDGRAFVAGASPTIADCTLAAAFQFARFAQVEIAPSFAALARWDRAYRDRPAARSVLIA